MYCVVACLNVCLHGVVDVAEVLLGVPVVGEADAAAANDLDHAGQVALLARAVHSVQSK